MNRFFTLLGLLLLSVTALVAQDDGQAAIDYLKAKHTDLGLTAADVSELEITDNYVSGGIQHVYVLQRHHDIPVHNAQFALHFRGDRLVASTNDFVPNITDLQLPIAPAVSAQQAVNTAISAATETFGAVQAIGQEEDELLFRQEAVSPKPIKASLAYLPGKDGVRLVWRVYIDQHAQHSDYWAIMLDATDGSVLDKDNMVLKCNFGSPGHQHDLGQACANMDPELPVSEKLLSKVLADGAKYNVFPFGVESPAHGERRLEVDPADDVASPFGWHDVNGEEGPEYTITRGNNVYAYRDRDDTPNSPDPDVIADGGDSLTFDFFYEDAGGTDTIAKAAISQLFYLNNKVHDWLVHAGFDEASGNFQRTNYSGDGEDRDHVLAEAQDGSGTNNANFFGPQDGQNGVMQMFLWTAPTPPKLTVNNGGGLAGTLTTGDGLFGPSVPDTALVGQLAIALDDTFDPRLVCAPAVNSDEIGGKIALIQRGECNFENKVYNAQLGGAIAAIVCNDAAEGTERGGIVNMADGDEVLDVTIPSLFLTRESCAPILAAVEAGDSISVTFQNRTPAPVDGDFDSGIVAHEYGHGVTLRLVGGPGNSGCLSNDEQMGEGWSDFFSIASTPQTNVEMPDGTEPRAIGNFAISRDPISGPGIRSQPYSTDMSVNDKTYDSVISDGAAPHDLGETWATTLLDLYWNLVARDGLDPDLIRGTGGNNLAVQLVVEGLKFTRCNPSLIDGRDGILTADEILFDGANSCLIWETFARRGLGFSATAGDRDDRTDNEQAFDISPYCIGGVQVVKTVDEATISAGEGVTFTLETTSYRDGLTKGVVLTDIIPDGMTLDENSIRGSSTFSVDGNQITFTLGEMEFEDTETILYSVATDPDLASVQSFFDDAEDGDDNWELENPVGNTLWELNDTTPYAGEFAWFAPNVADEQDQILRNFETFAITGDKPALRFFTKYETEPRWDAGIVEVSTDGTTWDKVDDKFLRGRYRGEIDSRGTDALQGVTSFWGTSDDYVETVIDLSDYVGQDVFVRFHWFSDAAVSGRGWWVDNIEVLDVINYDGQATLTSSEGDNWVTQVGDLGVLVESGDIIDNTNDPRLGQTEVTVFPNPAGDFTNVRISSERPGKASIQLISTDGRMVYDRAVDLVPGNSTTTIPTDQLPAGVYLVQVVGANRVSTTKLTLR